MFGGPDHVAEMTGRKSRMVRGGGCFRFRPRASDDTPLDLAPALDDDLHVRYSAAGDMLMGPVGSHAVRAAIEQAQPLLSLHGHVHESRGRARLGRTVCFNPGSDYQSGVLRGVLVRVSRKRGVADYTFTTG